MGNTGRILKSQRKRKRDQSKRSSISSKTSPKAHRVPQRFAPLFRACVPARARFHTGLDRRAMGRGPRRGLRFLVLSGLRRLEAIIISAAAPRRRRRPQFVPGRVRPYVKSARPTAAVGAGGNSFCLVGAIRGVLQGRVIAYNAHTCAARSETLSDPNPPEDGILPVCRAQVCVARH